MITAIFFVVVFFAICYEAIALRCVHAFFSRNNLTPDDWRPPVTVLKPVNGLDFEVAENLSSFLQQSYPTYQVLFGVESELDPVVPVLRRLIKESAHRDTRLIITGKLNAANRKIGILQVLSRYARHDLWVISDSDTRVSPTYLKEIVAPFQNSKIGMVTCLYRAAHAESFPAIVEALMIELDFFPAVLVAERIEELQFGLGATMALRRSALAAIGGFQSLRDYLADDYQLGYRIHQAGYQIVLSTRIVDLVMGDFHWKELWRHQLRWARTYRVCRPNGYVASILTQGFFLSMVYLLASDFSLDGWLLLSLSATIRFSMATLILCRYLKEPKWIEALMLLPFKEVLSAMIWSAALLGKRVIWRGKSFAVEKDGRMLTLESRQKHFAASPKTGAGF